MYNPYNPYQMSMPQYNYPQQTQTATYQQVQPQQLNTNKIFVSGIEEVKMKVLPPNSQWIFLDNEKSILYQKTIDNTGHFEVKMYDIVEHQENAPVQPDYVCKKDFEQLQAEFNSLKERMKGYGRGNNQTEERK